MKEPKNPFSFRSTESIESKHTFLKIFGHTILDALPDDCLSNKVTVFRSSPGGGKTALFRIFTPESLTEIVRDRTTHREIFGKLKGRGIINRDGDSGPPLGIYLRLYDYAVVEDADAASEHNNNRYLFSLIGTRLIIRALTGILKIHNAGPEDLDRITIQKPPDRCIAGVPLPCNGKTLYDWAAKTERDICSIINRFDAHRSEEQTTATGSIVDYLHVICHNNLLFDGRPAATTVLILLDDLHELASAQRKNLLEKIIKARVPAPVWIAERLEALQINEIIIDYGRESSVVNLETYWKKGNAFDRFARQVSKKRTDHASLDFDIDLYKNLDSNIATTSYRHDFQKAIKKIRERIIKDTHGARTYDSWIKEQENRSWESDYDEMISLKSLEIKIKRAEDKNQTRLLPLETDHEDGSPELYTVAKFLVHSEFKIPYYFGFSNISTMSTYNIEMFLKIAADLFDEIESQRIKDRSRETLDAARQEEIVKKIAGDYFEQIQTTGKNGPDVAAFLSALWQMAYEETMRPNAPYPPGVTGIGIEYEKYKRMMGLGDGDIYEQQTIGEGTNEDEHAYEQLVDVLRSCIAHNYMSVKTDAKQGGKRFVVLYLNRLLCAHFDLPLGRGGWRPKKPDEMRKWLKPPPPTGMTRAGGGAQP